MLLFGKAEEQQGEDDVKFSFDDEGYPRLPQVSCHITYTTPETHDIIRDNIRHSPIYSGKIQSIGPRYCPSIEDKVVRFADKERHQIFLEPEGIKTNEIYVNGVSSALPFDVQLAFIHSIPALRHAQIMRPAYAIEYDAVACGQIQATLESKTIEGLFLTGQINGTTGYEEAAAQGLIAGINAASKILGTAPLILKRSEAYIGVLIDDLITKPINEPYRMFTSRAEHRLLLRQDNADLRLRKYGYQYGLISKEQYDLTLHKEKVIEEELSRLKTIHKQENGKGYSLAQILARPENCYQKLCENYPDVMKNHGEEINFQIELNVKYAGYIKRQQTEIEKLSLIETIQIPSNFNYAKILGLRTEAKQKLSQAIPQNLGQALRIPGVSPADISVLMIALNK